MAKILIVDDEADMRFALRQLLEELGHKVEEAGDGQEALAKFNENPSELVLLDLRLPGGMDGKEILLRLRAKDSRLPIFVITGYPGPGMAEDLRRAGAAQYFAKPFHHKDLIAAIAKALSLAALKAGGRSGERLATKLESPWRFAASASRTLAKPPFWSAAKIALIGVAAVLAAAPLLVLKTFRSQVLFYTLPSAHASAAVWAGGELWVADWYKQIIYRLRLNAKGFELARTHDLKGQHLTGLALAGRFAYSADSWSRLIRRHRVEPDFAVAQETPSPGPNPSCLHWDEKNLWSCDSVAGKIYLHRPDMSVAASYKTKGGRPVAIASDGAKLWIADSQTQEITRYRLDRELIPEKSWRFEEPQSRHPLSGLALGAGRLWIVRDGSPLLEARTLGQLSRFLDNKNPSVSGINQHP